MSETIEQEEVKVVKIEQTHNSLVIFNDDVNTFDHVIESLIKVCKHETVQAEQCTWIIHYNGKCSVKNDSLGNLKPLKQALIDRGIDAKIH